MTHDDTAIVVWLFDVWQRFVFWSSIISVFIAAIIRWTSKWVPRWTPVLEALLDLINVFGALNLREHIAPKTRDQWTEEERAVVQAAQDVQKETKP